jgi:hypothetical protein
MSPVCSCFGLVIPPISICQSSPHRRCTQLQTDAAATHTTCVIWSALALFGNPSICIRRSFLHQYCVQVQIDAAATHTTWVVNLQLVACPTPCYSTAGSQLGLSLLVFHFWTAAGKDILSRKDKCLKLFCMFVLSKLCLTMFCTVC